MADGMQKMLPESHPKRKHLLHPLCARTAFSCNKLFLFIYALVYLFVGIIMMAIGVLVELYRDRIDSLDNRLAAPTALLILVGLVIALNALCGIVGTVMEKPLLLRVFLVVTTICFLLQVTIGVVAFIYREELPNVMSSEFMFAIKGYSKNKGVTDTLNWIQPQFKCCGFNSYEDYHRENPDYGCTSQKPKQCRVPQTCCQKKEGVALPDTCGYYIMGSSRMYNDIYQEGCTHAFLQWLMKHLDLVGAIALGFAIPQIFGILLSYYFLRRVQEYRVWYRVDNFR